MWRETKILLIDDNAARRHELAIILSFLGEEHLACTSQDWRGAVAELDPGREVLSVLLGDVQSQGGALELTRQIVGWDEFLPLLTVGEVAIGEWPEDLRRRVLASLEIPLSYNKLLDSLHRAQVYREMYDQARDRGRQREPNLFRSLVGTSRAIGQVRKMMQQVADTEASVLILGESGTGKEVVARNLHYHSRRREAPFVPVNCGAIPAELLESELFGHEKGAFTGAITSRAGRFELANGGTLFLDEIGDMPLPMQVETLVTGLEHLARSLAAGYASSPASDFEHSVHTALTVFPVGSITQIAVADVNGGIVYSNLAPSQGQPSVSIADREHFRVHRDRAADPHLFISHPVLGRVSGLWTIQFSYPILDPRGAFAGAVVLSVAPDYISDYFRKVFASDADVAMLLHGDGTYLARSAMQSQVLGRRVPAEREFLHAPHLRHGEYFITAPVDGVLRYYAWHRVREYPLVVSIGLGQERALASVRANLRDNLWANVIGTLLVLGASLWIALLFARLHHDRQLLAEGEERFKLALEGGSLGAWDWDIRSGRLIFDERWCRMLGYRAGMLAAELETVHRLAHPDDWAKIQAAFNTHLYGRSELFEIEHRARHRDGRWIWVHARGRVTHRSAEGQPLRMTGTQADISQRVAETLLRRALLDNTGAEIFLVTPERDIRFSNQHAVETFSPDGRSLDGRSMRAIHCDDGAYADFQRHYTALRAGKGIRTEYRLRTASGEPRWFSVHGTLLDPNQTDGDVIWTMIDLTERKQAEEALGAARGRLGQIIEHFPGGILVENEDDRVVVANQALCDLFACVPRPAASLIGQAHAALRRLFPREVLDSVLCNEARGPSETLLADGRSIRTLRIPIRHGAQGVDHLWIVQDVTEQRRHEQELEQLASTDALTGLANRHTFLERLDIELARIARGGPGGMLAMLDLDHFKRVNDRYGHAAGDAVLTHLAGILRRVLRREDMAARLGGEEFALLLPGTDAAGAATLGERLRSALEQSHVETSKGEVRITTSIGLAPLVGDARTLLARADAALYQAKNNGRNRVVMAADEDVPA